jgi:hypothetical protein
VGILEHLGNVQEFTVLRLCAFFKNGWEKTKGRRIKAEGCRRESVVRSVFAFSSAFIPQPSTSSFLQNYGSNKKKAPDADFSASGAV